MDINRLTGDLKNVLERARAQLNQEIEKAQKAAAAANVERTAAQHALVQLTAQHAQVQDQLNAVTKHLGRASSLAALDSDITKAKAELKKLQGETEKVDHGPRELGQTMPHRRRPSRRAENGSLAVGGGASASRSCGGSHQETTGMTDNTNADEIEKLKKELKELKAALAPAPDDRAAVGAWRDQMRAASEARASVMHPAVVRDMAVLPDDVVRDIAMRDNRAPTGRPGVIPSSQTVSSNVSGPPVNTSGWRNPSPLGPPPGVAQADRLMAAEDRDFRRQRIVEEAQRRALFEEKKTK